MRFTRICVLASTTLVLTAAAAPAGAQTVYGAAAAPDGSSDAHAPGTATQPTGTQTAPWRAPITARRKAKPYHGPVYELDAAGRVIPYTPAPKPVTPNSTGGASASADAPSAPPRLLVPGALAQIVDGLAAAPAAAPPAVQQAIWAANAIIGRPYVYGGGHGSFDSRGYDCSGTVSYALHGANLLDAPLDSGEFMSFAVPGRGTWITILTNPGHAYLDIAGIRLDTSAADDPSNQQGPRWRPLRRSNHAYTVRHPADL